jgi:hypothetical protein
MPRERTCGHAEFAAIARAGEKLHHSRGQSAISTRAPLRANRAARHLSRRIAAVTATMTAITGCGRR